MRIFSSLFTIGALAIGAWYTNDRYPDLKNQALEFFHTSTFHTLEVRHTGKQIMENNRYELLKTAQHKYKDVTLKFYPYLLMEVKYTQPNNTTNEGIILWDLVDGEMVVNTHDWEKTHGFGDCIHAGLERNEFKIINLLAQKGGSIDREGLTSSLHVENEVLDNWLERCRRKKLIVQKGNQYRLHMQTPRLNVLPHTTVDDRLVTKQSEKAQRIPRRFSPIQIRKMAERAFGYDFAIRSTLDVYLPIFSITVENPDSTLHTSNWNAVNGKRLSHSSFIE
ncbi:MAG: hypothetical protein SNF33_03335 [Candidatus Algichlamydia australiensis]|nr:hypothetical protein [Chlamydiales bacterium]